MEKVVFVIQALDLLSKYKYNFVVHVSRRLMF